MKALITGGSGFAGHHLARHLVECGDDVIVTTFVAPQGPSAQSGASAAKGAKLGVMPGVRRTAKQKIDTFELTPPEHRTYSMPPAVQALLLDITDKAAVEQIIKVLRPDAIYHLAALTFVPEAEQNQEKVYQVNLQGSINVMEAVAKHCPQTRILYVSSSEVYGDPRPGSLPLLESSEMRPVSAYGAAKAAADLSAFRFAYKERLHVVRVRPFPHTGPGQSSRFAISSFARQLAEIKLGSKAPEIKVGNLEAKRDYSDVLDIVRGYREALENGKRGESYNLCSGSSLEIKEMLDRLISIAEIKVDVKVDASRLRPVEIPDYYGSYAKAQRDFGWKPRIDFDGTLHSIFAYWVEVLES